MKASIKVTSISPYIPPTPIIFISSNFSSLIYFMYLDLFISMNLFFSFFQFSVKLCKLSGFATSHSWGAARICYSLYKNSAYFVFWTWLPLALMTPGSWLSESHLQTVSNYWLPRHLQICSKYPSKVFLCKLSLPG